MNRRTLFISAVVALVSLFVVAMLLFQGRQGDQQRASAHHNAHLLERDGAPIKGPKDAKVTIVEFFDPACATCREFYPHLKRLISYHAGKVRVMVRYAPLHTGSDRVVQMLEAARLQGRFWEALERLLMRQSDWVVDHTSHPMRAWAVLEALDLDMDRLGADMDSPDVIRVVAQDIQDGKTLKVRATPEFFVNGTPLPRFGLEPLQRLTQEAVDDLY